MRASNVLFLVASAAPLALAAPVITSPAAGASVPGAAALTVKWADDAVAPLSSTMGTCTVQLMAGSNTVNQAIVAALAPVAVGLGTASVPVTAAVSGSAPNAYFISMLCNGATGGTYQTFSSHFTLTGMTGAFPAAVLAAASAVTVTTPPAVINKLATAPVAAPGAPGAEDPAMFTVPFNLQSGTIRYAPMQPVPPTAITATNTAPLYPTSAVQFAVTALPIASIATTYTQAATFSVASHPNSAAAASSPVNDMQRFLNRWKD
ncbi:putative beta-1,6-glucan boisynthesis protein (Knh1) [Glarea lozoyensis ATCC 20868]|uniref:Putative beta-1,6-glucan boisynthesis protein (Knh1) n=1 Tax=Glarea lozoyensis (strain ATCC 20868 / MF5171) TaxID=1116229 RepID=S3D4C1_GLAL2|nr:putative beta-1,6-glucan biosynthesis protein (Knh1) [Glarea lozoyensis ATCC 20868]EPE32665.1 putative beta-1,6-glucan boisynthesis protein (Knh1) [Glarea lozoyensis ATCC 20868]